MNRLLVALSCALAMLLVGANGCGGSVNPPVTPGTGGTPSVGGAGPVAGATSVTRCELACANLVVLGCPEDQTSCVAICELHTTDNRFSQNLDCRINARTKAEAQACGPASCRE